MKTFVKNSFVWSLVMLWALSLTFKAEAGDDNKELEIGKKAPKADVEMKTVSGETITLNSMKKENGLLVIFSCNTCPYVKAWEDRYLEVSDLAQKRDVGMVALNPNERIRDRGESLEDMKKRADKKNFNFTYALDRNHKLAEAFGATHTPHVYLFNSEMELVYRGAIDDNYENADKVKKPFLKNAIKDMTKGNTIDPKTTASLGCTIKWTED